MDELAGEKREAAEAKRIEKGRRGGTKASGDGLSLMVLT
jgi:hypothetical protein